MPYKSGTWGEQAKIRNEKRVDQGYFKKYTSGLKDRIFRLLGDSCITCGFTDKRALQIDHVNNDGYKDRWTKISDTNRYLRVLKDPAKYQILCANCNWIKRYEKEVN